MRNIIKSPTILSNIESARKEKVAATKQHHLYPTANKEKEVTDRAYLDNYNWKRGTDILVPSTGRWLTTAATFDPSLCQP
ncbi:MAG UNVERIFIED_CONTAM: hypothetical protein LVR29_13605 [Microcystis novacekii LVE1205-3]|jgi:hypothetical protein